MVMYQHDWKDGFFHRYSYDVENRLTLVETSRDSVVWEKDARYEYYRHGPLARITLGDQQVQGLDYAYTLQGWLKGINSTGGKDSLDMGQDGHTGSLNQYTARDAIGLTLNYFGNDYTAINGMPFPGYSAYLPSGAYRPLYNGNISSSSVYQKKFDYDDSPGGPLIFYNYSYDQLNRLTGQNGFKGYLNTATGLWDSLSTNSDMLKERIVYDGNGNVLKYLRKGIDGGHMDSLNYFYYAGTNRLKRITDSIPPNTYTSQQDNLILDIDNQPDNNYCYDAIGNLTKDSLEKITSIKWNVYGKIQEINRTATSEVPATNIKYTYDALGNRISEVVTTDDNVKYTWYVRDAQGNIMSTYTAEGNDDLEDLTLNQGQKVLYGSSRLGTMDIGDGVDGGPDPMQYYYGIQEYNRGEKQYELTNHLGNVLATISDRKFGVSSDGSSLIDYYEADIVTAQDYFPFGMISREALPNSGKNYAMGFNGKWNDNAVKGLGNQQDYGMRIYDPRVGRFLSVDPITRQYPQLTPYQFASNSPISGVDQDGLEYSIITNWLADKAKASGNPRLSGFIRSFGAADINAQTQQVINNTINGKVGAVVLQVYGYTTPGITQGLVQTAKKAFVDKDPEAQGEVLGMLAQGAFGEIVAKARPAAPRVMEESSTSAVVEEPVASTNNQTTAANSGNSQAAFNNTGFSRPSWQQTETDVVTSDYREQVAFKNGNEVPKNTRGSVRPEGYKPGDAIEAKNYSLTTEKGITSLIKNVTKQVRQRQANLPVNTVQNIVIDVRGQGLKTNQLMKIRSRLTTQTGTKNINVTFKTD